MATPQANGHVKDLSLAAEGIKRIEWAAREMPVIEIIKSRFAQEKPLEEVSCAQLTSDSSQFGLEGSPTWVQDIRLIEPSRLLLWSRYSQEVRGCMPADHWRGWQRPEGHSKLQHHDRRPIGYAGLA